MTDTLTLTESPEVLTKRKVSPTPAAYHTVTPYLIVKGAAKAVAAGATVVKPVQDQFYGDRSGTFTDPFGHLWTIATHIEDVSPQEMQRRMSQMKPCGAS